jgi:large subunit ribosomal protein L4
MTEMTDLTVRDKSGNEVEKLVLEDGLFGTYVNRQLLHDAVLMYESNTRQGTSSTKTRSEVAGSGKKPWRQKGTGRARAGSFRSPLWRKGGVVFGPKPRDYSFSVPRKALRKALAGALLSKIRDSRLHLVDDLGFETPKTRQMADVLSNLGLKKSVLVVVGPSERNAYMSARNIARVEARRADDVNVRDVLKFKDLLVTREAFELLKKRAGDEAKGGAK